MSRARTFLPLALSLVLAAGVALVLGAGLAACARGARGGRARIGGREVRHLQQQASRELGCDARALSVTPLSDRVMQVHGCGQLRDYARAGGRRRGWYALQPVYLRAGTEMACPIQQLTVQAPSATIRQASGCGRTARYDLVCGSVECAWMMTAHGGAWAGEGGSSPYDAAAVATAPPAADPATADAAPGEIVVPDPPTAGAAASPGVAAPAQASPPAAVAAPAEASPPAAVVAVTTSGDELVIPEPPAAGSPEERLRAMLDAHGAHVHRCAGVGVVHVRASWTSDGAVTVGLVPPLAGTEAEQCLRAAIGAQRVGAGAAGEIVHPVR